ncbi:DUF228 domain-containing protein [Borreliella japonica]
MCRHKDDLYGACADIDEFSDMTTVITLIENRFRQRLYICSY